MFGMRQRALMRLWPLGSCLLVLFYGTAFAASPSSHLPEEFVPLSEVDASILQDMRYAGDHNFIGRPVKGYEAPRCILTRPAAMALAEVQKALKPFSLSLKVYDCYRPQRAVDDFMTWSKDPADARMQAEFYPRVNKKDVFKLGYVAEHSGHSRGSTMDLTLVPLPVPPQPDFRPGQRLIDCTAPVAKRFRDNSLDMGTGYDCFDVMATTLSPKVQPQARVNRMLLKTLMEDHGFVNYAPEWWHFTLKTEPYPETYFDFPVR